MVLPIVKNLLFLLAMSWSIAWKCYSAWIAAKSNNKRWFVALVIFNTMGILDMIYIFGIKKKKWSDIKAVLHRLAKKMK